METSETTNEHVPAVLLDCCARSDMVHTKKKGYEKSHVYIRTLFAGISWITLFIKHCMVYQGFSSVLISPFATFCRHKMVEVDRVICHMLDVLVSLSRCQKHLKKSSSETRLSLNKCP